MSAWRLTTWGSVVELQRGFDITKSEQSLAGGVPVVSSGGVSSYHDRSMAEGPGVVIGRKGTLGRVHFVEGEYWPHDTTLWVKDFKGNDPRFVYYSLQQLDTDHFNVGSASPTLNRNHVYPLPVRWPESLKIQRAIAEVLGTLDDKIAANERVSSTLDNLIRFEYLSLKGEPVPLGGLAKNVRDQVKPEVVDGEAIYLGLEHLPREHFWVTGHGNTSEITSAKSRFEEGDVLFGKLRPYFHKVVSAPFGGVCSTDVLVIRAMESDLAGLILAAVGSKETVAAAVSSSEGTRMPRTSWKDLSDTSIRWPGRSVAESFSHEVQRRADLAAKLGAESRALARARDELLPLLMSGKITVKDAEAAVSDAV